MGDIVIVNDANFEEEVIRSTIPVVVDFYADWCAPCRETEPVIQELSERWAGQVKFARVLLDESSDVAKLYGIQSIPAYLFLDGGREKGRAIGPIEPQQFRAILKSYFYFLRTPA